MKFRDCIAVHDLFKKVFKYMNGDTAYLIKTILDSTLIALSHSAKSTNIADAEEFSSLLNMAKRMNSVGKSGFSGVSQEDSRTSGIR